MENTIHKKPEELPLVPNWSNYQNTYNSFTWKSAKTDITGLPEKKGTNIAYEAIDRHAEGSKKNIVALRWLGKKGQITEYTYGELKLLSNRFANALTKLGIAKGDRVFALCGRIPELYIAAMGILKNRSVFSPLFSAFGPDPIATRLEIGEGKVLITTESLYRKKVSKIRDSLPKLEHIIIIKEKSTTTAENTYDFHELMEQASDDYTILPTSAQDMSLLHFTSGTTGKPKGAVHVHGAVVAHHITGKFVLDFHPGDIYWCTADPGWVTGISYGMIAPWTNGVTNVIDEGDFDTERWYSVLEQQKVTIWYTAPTAIRMMMKTGTELPKKFNLDNLRFIASVGEPLNPEAVIWGKEAFGLPIHDNWWQTETGAMMIANCIAFPIKPGSMGRPLPGVKPEIIQRDEEGNIKKIVEETEVVGELALTCGWPSMFSDYLHDEERYRKCFVDNYYFSGDLAKRDKDGYYWFVGRADDVINSAGHLISPFELESAFLEHPAVAEAGVIAKPDPVVMEYPKAFLALKPGYEDTPDLRKELRAFIRKRMGATVSPKEIDILPNLPKTKSGKIMRRLLKARELGLPEGDTSTLETEL